MNTITADKYKQAQQILSGCNTLLDACYIAEKYVKYNPEMKEIMDSMVYGKKYNNIVDYYIIINILNRLVDSNNKESAEKIISEMIIKTHDKTQNMSFNRIIRNKVPG
jgi:uncharacterized membrane-anchored protein YjiN (DUF445 family)